MSAISIDAIDITQCETEPIRFPGAVQPHGVLLVLQPESGIIVAASESCTALLGLPPASLLGQRLATLLGAEFAAALLGQGFDSLQPLLPLALNGRQWSVRAARNETGELLVDIECGDPDGAALPAMTYHSRRGLAVLRDLREVADIAQGAAELIRELTAFDRVMICRFDAQWNGEVIGEAIDATRNAGAEAYLGLNFPASDIPRLARELFSRCRVRLIPDVHYRPSALLATSDAGAIDLGISSLRSASPVHLEYLKKMGARATLVGALVVEGRLWGLVACQQLDAAKYFGPARRDAIAWLCEDIAALFQATLIRQRREREYDLAQRRRKLIAAIRALSFRELMQPENNADLLGVVGADGFALIVDAAIQTAGSTPQPERIRQLQRQRLEHAPGSMLFASSSLASDLSLDDAGDGIAGALFVSLLHRPLVTMIWFRRERQHALRWGGDPEKALFADAPGRLAPRKSFAQFQQDVRGRALAWSPEELDSAADLAALVEIEALREREAFAQTLLNSLPERIAVLDGQGVIRTVNDAWKNFAAGSAAAQRADQAVGVSYRDLCSAAEGTPGGAEALAAWAGIEAVLDKRRDSFSLDYPCPSPHEQRWFRLSVFPLLAPGEGAVVAHQDVTAHQLAQLALAASEDRYRRLREEQIQAVGRDISERKAAEQQVESLLRDQRAILESQVVGILKVRGRRIVWANSAFARMLGYPGERLNGQSTRLLYPSDEAFDEFGRLAYPRLARGEVVRSEVQLLREDGTLGWYEIGSGLLDLQSDESLHVFVDISRRKAAEVALRDSEERLRNIFQSMAEGLVVHRRDGKIVDANPAAEALLGLSRDQLLGRESIDPRWRAVRADGTVFPGAEHPAMVTLRSGESLRNQIMGIEAPGRGMRWISVNSQALFGAQSSRPEAVIATFIDVSERLRVERELRNSEAELKTAQRLAAMGNWEWDLRTDTNRWSEEIFRIFGRDPLLGPTSYRDIERYFTPPSWALLSAAVEQCLKNGIPYSLDLEVVRADASRRWVVVFGNAVADEQGEIIALHGTLQDIDSRKRAEAELDQHRRHLESVAAEQAAHLRDLARELTHAEQRERDGFYELLHDDVQPLLVATRLLLSSLSVRTLQADCLRVADKCCVQISRILQVMRTLTHYLSPPLVRERGLIPALDALIYWVKANHGLHVDLSGAHAVEPEDIAIRMLCFNAVRELLMNVVKHAETDCAELRLERVAGECLRITVEDHGCGFDPAIISNGSGLPGIDRRLRMFGGSLKIDSRPGQGTVATLLAPLRLVAESADPGATGRDDAQTADRR